MRKLIKVEKDFTRTEYWDRVASYYNIIAPSIEGMVNDLGQVLTLDIENTRSYYKKDNNGHCVYDLESQGYTSASEITHIIVDDSNFVFGIDSVYCLEDLLDMFTLKKCMWLHLNQELIRPINPETGELLYKSTIKELLVNQKVIKFKVLKESQERDYKYLYMEFTSQEELVRAMDILEIADKNYYIVKYDEKDYLFRLDLDFHTPSNRHLSIVLNEMNMK